MKCKLNYDDLSMFTTLDAITIRHSVPTKEQIQNIKYGSGIFDERFAMEISHDAAMNTLTLSYRKFFTLNYNLCANTEQPKDIAGEQLVIIGEYLISKWIKRAKYLRRKLKHVRSSRMTCQQSKIMMDTLKKEQFDINIHRLQFDQENITTFIQIKTLTDSSIDLPHVRFTKKDQGQYDFDLSEGNLITGHLLNIHNVVDMHTINHTSSSGVISFRRVGERIHVIVHSPVSMRFDVTYSPDFVSVLNV